VLIFNALSVVFSTSTLPAVVVIPKISSSDFWEAAMMMETASSCPGSQSNITFLRAILCPPSRFNYQPCYLLILSLILYMNKNRTRGGYPGSILLRAFFGHRFNIRDDVFKREL